MGLSRLWSQDFGYGCLIAGHVIWHENFWIQIQIHTFFIVDFIICNTLYRHTRMLNISADALSADISVKQNMKHGNQKNNNYVKCM